MSSCQSSGPDRSSKARAPRVGALLALATVLVVVGAACGSSAPKPAAAASTTTTVAGRGQFAAAFAAFSTCMGQHGVKIATRRPGAGGPRPTGGTGAAGTGAGTGGGGGNGFGGGGGFGRGGFGSTPSSLPPGVTASEYQTALKACQSKLPTGGFGGGFGGGARGGAATAAYRSCMSDHGVTLPTFGGQGSSSTTTASAAPPTTFNRNDPKFVAANKICMALLPARSGTTTTTAG